PTANAGADQNLFQCTAAPISWAASCSDVDGNLTNCQLISGVGSYNGTKITFTPTGSGTYDFILQATDACGAVGYDTASVTVTLNSAPTVTAQADTSLFLCTSQPVCVSYLPSDPDGLAGMTESMISGFGAIDTLNNQICFTPATAGAYDFIVGVTDACGVTDRDTVTVAVAFGTVASIDCPGDTIFVSLCDTSQICNMLDISPDSATVTVSHGAYANGQHCFIPDSSGVYTVDVIASVQCGADTCQLMYKVNIGQAAEISCPEPQDIFICEPGQICIPISVVTPGATFDISPIGSYNAGNICFQADTSGYYVISVVATTSCGSDSCEIIADVTINSNPVAVTPSSPVDTFLCLPDNICYQFNATDVDGGALIWSKLVGDGALEAGGEWCFDANTGGTWSITAVVSDSCGAADTTSLTYNITMNSAPVVTLDDEVSVFLCNGDSYCFNYTTMDADNNVTAEILLAGVGTLDTASNEVCFTPTSTGMYKFIMQTTDACGATGLDTINVAVEVGNEVAVTCPGDTSFFFCGPSQVCRPVDIPVDTNVVVSPIGSYNPATGKVCFDADTAGHYVITVQANSDCGSNDCRFVVDVMMNSNPVAVDPAPVDTFRCGSGQVCHQFEANDVDGGMLAWSKLGGDGAVDTGGNWCLDVSTNGVYNVTVAVTDPCGAADTTSLTYTVTINSAPVVSLGDDHSVFLCDGDSYCVTYTVSDGDDNVTLEALVGGVGVIDTTANEVCFTPAADGPYELIVRATDACGAFDEDTVMVTVTRGYPVAVTCPEDTSIFFCGPSQVCRPVDIPVDTNVIVSPIGSYSPATGKVCFDADTAGHYVITVQANSDCGSANCQFVVDVVMNSNPIAEDFTPVDVFLCAPEQLCFPLTATDIDGGTLAWNRLNGNGTIDTDGNWCITASATGTYSVTAAVSDSCGAADTVEAVVYVIYNSAPVIMLGNDTTIFQCEQEQLCFLYTVSDVDDNIVLEELIDGGGLAVIDTMANSICFTPEPKSPYQFIVRVTDSCGLTDLDTIIVTADVNHAPVVNAGDDFSRFLCGSEQTCFDVSWSDEDGNVASAYLVSAFGELVGTQVCFTPDSSGLYRFIVGAEDACAAVGIDTVEVAITINSAPVCVPPPDTSFFLCMSAEVTLPATATDVNGNFDHCEIVSGPGSITGGQWTHTPTAAGEVTVVFACYDACDASCSDSFTVTFEFNHPPVPFAGNDTTVFMCEPGEILSWPVTCSDPDDNLVSCDLVSTFGEYNAGEGRIYFTIPQYEKTYKFIMEAIDACGDTAYDTSLVTVNFNEPPVVNLPADFVAFFEDPTTICFNADIYDPDNNLSNVSVSPIGEYHPTSDEICLFAAETGVFCLVVTATDACGEVTTDSICIELEIDECFRVQIEKVHNAYQGHRATVPINFFGSAKELGGFDLLISYDQSVLSLMSLEPAPLLEDCDWEYFTYRFGASGNCTSCPSGILRITAIAETNNGAYHPDCYLAGAIGPIALANFLVSDNYAYGCQYAPINFFWIDCGDNTFSSREGDTLWTSRLVYNFEHLDITDNQFGFPGFYGAHDSCMIGGGPGKPKPIRCVDYIDGGIDIICPDSIDDRGDINLNGIAYEIADAVTYTEYMIYGLAAFTVNPEGQRAASDVNADGITLTIADLAYLIRVIIGDASPIAKPLPLENLSANLDLRANEIVISKTETPINVMRFTFEGNVEPTIAEGLEHLNMRYHYDGIVTRVIVCNMEDKRYVQEGPVLRIGGSYDLKKVEVASAGGQMMRVEVNALPTTFTLRQNYPNPFNPSTVIQFSLPQTTDWELTVYNVLGREVEHWKGCDAGTVTINWNAARYASGVYFYRLKAANYINSKTMVLLK
ncbi:MAG: T9SS type A sorting domain-containing protein, partial [candidate division Zixibacteria bacterium]|nr:T9SS type A sorting domain-containing protein [candidate division Zixibacteria bacterium]